MPSATIFYTTNGSAPTTSSPVYSGPITVATTETLKAIATATGYSTSAVSSAAYTITLPAAAPTFSVAAGTYTSAQTVAISATMPSATIFYTTNGSAPTTSSPVYSGPITVSTTETLQAIATATGYSTSAVNSAAYTIALPAATPTFSLMPGVYTSTQILTIRTKTHSATIYFTTDGSNATTLSVQYSGPITVAATETVKAIAVAAGYPNSDEAWGVYLITPPAATPTFSPAGGIYRSAQKVTISTATPLTTIHYTTDGAIPSDNSPVYSGPIDVMATQTVRAVAVPSGRYNPSSTKEATPSISAEGAADYTMDLPARNFSVAIFPAALDIIDGHSGTTTVSVIPENGFASAVSFSCSGLPEGASCSFSPATVTPDGAVASTALTVTMPSVTAAVRRTLNTSFPGSALALALCCFGWKKQRRLQMLLLAGVAAGLSLCTGCGVQASSVPASISTVAVIATSGSLQPATSLTLTVQ